MQIPLFKPQTEWVPPESFPDLSQECEIAIDLETKDPNLNHAMGSGSIVKNGNIVVFLLLLKPGRVIFLFAHEGGGNMDKALVRKWLNKKF